MGVTATQNLIKGIFIDFPKFIARKIPPAIGFNKD